VVKPDWGITGGAELVLDRVVKMLREDGHRVEVRRVPVQQANRHPRGVGVPSEAWNALPDYFRYMSLAETFERLDLSGTDLVISTQPPSYAADHPRHLALFFHHLRIYYDLADVHVRAGYTDPALHAEAQRAVQDLDRRYFAGVGWFLTNSSRVSERLRQFNGVSNSSVLHAGPTSSSPAHPVTDRPGTGPVLCVSRSEFTKRTELFVHAMAHLRDRSGVLVGSGGRLPWLRVLRERFSAPGVDLDSFGAEDLWCNKAELLAQPDVPERPDARLRIAGHVENRELHDLYRRASCLVAPALDEDYGLTAVEAMAWGLPAVVCTDGGGLADLVEHDVSGLVVEPTGKAIAEAVERICSDPDLSRRLSEGARERSQQFTWARAHEELREGLAQVMEEARP
jgi:glycosyltransferase involved in cell wall biosynthesis